MWQRLFSPIVLVAVLALAACAGQQEVAKPAPAAPPGEAKPAWQEEWERVLEAAKREGRVVVIGPSGDEPRRALTEPFERKYGIKVEFQSAYGPAVLGQLKTERAAGQYLRDINIGGSTTWIPVRDEYLEPIEPTLILPDVKDPKNWWGGKLLWLDNERRILPMGLVTGNILTINTNLVRPEEIKSYKDLLHPKWKGKILIDDPRVPSAGSSHFQFFYLHKDLGPGFIRALVKQDLTISRDARQNLDWLAAGRFPIAIGTHLSISVVMKKAGLPIEDLDPRRIKEGSSLVGSQSYLFLLNKAPHPNAAKVYINWLLSKEGQAAFVPTITMPSLRLDVPTDHLEPWQLPQAGYIRMDTLEAHESRDLVMNLMKQLLGD